MMGNRWLSSDLKKYVQEQWDDKAIEGRDRKKHKGCRSSTNQTVALMVEGADDCPIYGAERMEPAYEAGTAAAAFTLGGLVGTIAGGFAVRCTSVLIRDLCLGF